MSVTQLEYSHFGLEYDCSISLERFFTNCPVYDLRMSGPPPTQSLEIGIHSTATGETADPAGWAIHRLTEQGAQPLETGYDPASGMLVARVDQPGRFQVQRGTVVGGPPPSESVLWRSKPNPFPASTVIEFYLTAAARTRLEIVDVTGRRVAELINAPLDAGYHRLDWDRMMADGQRAPAGVYMYRLRSGSFSATHKLVVVR